MTTFYTSIGAGYAPAVGKAVPATHITRAFDNTLALKQGDQALDQLVGAPVTDTSTGTVNNFSLANACQVIRFTNSSALVITGLTNGRSGRQILVSNLGASTIRFSYNDSGSTAGNRILTPSLSGQTLGIGGAVWLYYDGTSSAWRLFVIDPGSPITPAYNSGAAFTASSGTWTVDSGDVQTFTYQQRGTQLTIAAALETTSVSATPAYLKIALPSPFTIAKRLRAVGRVIDNSSVGRSQVYFGAGLTEIQIYPETAANWLASTNTTEVHVPGITIEIQ